MTMATGLPAATASTNARTDPASGTDRGTTRQITIRSTQMSHLLHEDLARAHLEQRLAQAERQRRGNTPPPGAPAPPPPWGPPGPAGAPVGPVGSWTGRSTGCGC